jgi:hypothetical protein
MRGDGSGKAARRIELESRDSSWGEGGFSLRSVNLSGDMEMLQPSFASINPSNIQAGGKPSGSDDRFRRWS